MHKGHAPQNNQGLIERLTEVQHFSVARISRCRGLSVSAFVLISFAANGEVGRWKAPVLPDEPSTTFGLWTGSFSVDRNGQARYRIPISFPAGRGGIEPRLTLVYGSDFGQSSLGFGFHLEGVSSISRCRSVLAINGMVRGVKWDSADSFCLDGAPLVRVNSPFNVVTRPEPHFQFATEPDQLVRILAYTNGRSPADATWDIVRFEMYQPDGTIVEFGGTSNSRMVGPRGITRTWAANKLSDRYGNFATYGYRKIASNLYPQLVDEDQEVLLSHIEYTGNDGSLSGTPLPPTASIDFEYDAEPNPSISYFAGSSRRDFTSSGAHYDKATNTAWAELSLNLRTVTFYPEIPAKARRLIRYGWN
jgi:hypothetical protein